MHHRQLTLSLIAAGVVSAATAAHAGDFATEPRNFAVSGGVAFFAARDAANGEELWRTDGKTSGTRLVRDIVPGPDSSGPAGLTDVAGTLFFTVADRTQLWKSDGTAAGTALVKDGLFNTQWLSAAGNTLYFSSYDEVFGTELWKSDGTTAGTAMVKDIWPGNEANPSTSYPTSVNGTVFFTTSDGTHGAELWKTDGTEAGTVLVRDILPGPGHGQPHFLVAFGDGILFQARDSGDNWELWRSDGTFEGTQLVRDINPGPDGSGPAPLVRALGGVYFSAYEPAHGWELWKTDGTNAGTTLVSDVNPGPAWSEAWWVTAGGDHVYFVASTQFGPELWKTDGSDAGTSRVVAPYTLLYPENLTYAGGTLFFTTYVDGTSLWRTDGTTARTRRVSAFTPDGQPSFLTAFHDQLLCQASDGHDRGLWIANGSGGHHIAMRSGQ